jgi:hypothetical protein
MRSKAEARIRGTEKCQACQTVSLGDVIHTGVIADAKCRAGQYTHGFLKSGLSLKVMQALRIYLVKGIAEPIVRACQYHQMKLGLLKQVPGKFHEGVDGPALIKK